MGRYRVTVEVKAHSAREAREIVTGKRNPEMSGAEKFQLIAKLQRELNEANERDDDDRAAAILDEMRRIKKGSSSKSKAPKQAKLLRDEEHPIILGGYLLDKKTLTPIRRQLTKDEIAVIERDRIRRYGV